MTAEVRGLAAMKHTSDPKADLLAKIGDISDGKVFGPQILVATYFRPAITAGGIHLSPKTLQEDQFQGKIGLVLAMGPTAFKETGNIDFGGLTCKVGDWIVYSPHDGLQMAIHGKDNHCRLIDDVQVRMTVPNPDFLL